MFEIDSMLSTIISVDPIIIAKADNLYSFIFTVAATM